LADRILVLKAVDIVSGESLTFSYDVTTSALVVTNETKLSAIKITKISDA
jgi:hypothetical protein